MFTAPLRSRRNRARLLALVPLASLSAIWTGHLVSGPENPEAALPPGAVPPAEAIEHPASYSIPGRVSLGVAKGREGDVIAAASTNGIPSAALAAYQRAETVINNADKGCHIAWQLIAAIGRVESDHGRYGGNTLTTTGVSRPGIYGIALDGTHGTAEIGDTDAGQYDRDRVFDRAVGPMQFIPSTWADVGVDADGDGKRNPQDIDDAALAAAVYLCSGSADLATDAGQRQAVYRYNHSRSYVDLVLQIAAAYLAGDYAAVPNYTTSAVTFTPDHSYTAPGGRNHGGKRNHGPAGSNDNGGSETPDEEPPAEEPQPEEPQADDTKTPIKAIEDTVKNLQDGVKDTVKTVDDVLTLAQAVLACSADGYNALLTPRAWKECIAGYTTP